jgi:lysophospholipase L1-like esterase
MPNPDFDRNVIDLARTQALEELAQRRAIRASRVAAFQAEATATEGLFSLQAAATSGTLVAEGDSWFDYPGSDVLDYLEDVYRYKVESLAKAGHRIEDMAYAGGQLDDLARRLEKLLRDGKTVRAILLSGGGNDVMGTEFGMFLEHTRSGLDPLNAKVIEGVIGERVRTAYLHILTRVTTVAQTILGSPVPILVHGYSGPVPDGRGVLGGFWFLPGPWIAPGFRDKGFADSELDRRIIIVGQLMDRFNEMLIEIAGLPDFPHVHYVNLRGTLPTGANVYKEFWANELHPTERGFAEVTRRFAEVLQGLP